MTRKTQFVVAVFGVALMVSAVRSGSQLAAPRIGYKGIYIGEPVASVPTELSFEYGTFRGKYKNEWMQVEEIQNQIYMIMVVYRPDDRERDWVLGSKVVTLADAIRIHSARPGLAAPAFGLAKDIHGEVYGIVDVSNLIVYEVVGRGITEVATDPKSGVQRVTYLNADAPVINTARQSLLSAATSSRLLNSSPPGRNHSQ